MDRLTERSFGGHGILKDDTQLEFAVCKLATYEDTGLEPSEITQIETAITSLIKGERGKFLDALPNSIFK